MENEYVISSVIGNVKIVEIILHRLATEVELSPNKAHDLRLMLGECIVNAIVHGNQAEPEKQVIIQYKIEQRSLSFCVIDQGPGFDLEGVKDPTHRMNLEEMGGRGVFIIQNLSDECSYCITDKSFQFSVNLDE
jgi:serine/threonine-protein kinase RsbW